MGVPIDLLSRLLLLGRSNDHINNHMLGVPESTPARLDGLNAFISYGASQSALQVAKCLLSHGANVFLCFADLANGRHVAKELLASLEVDGFEQLKVLQCDLERLDSVRECAQAFLALNVPLDYLLLNSLQFGVDGSQETVDGFERVFQCNFLAQFLLTMLLEPALLQAPDGARVVHVSASTHMFSEFKADDPNGKKYYAEPIIGKYRQFGAVCSATLLFAGVLDWRYRQNHGVGKITSNCVNSAAAAVEELADGEPSNLTHRLAKWSVMELDKPIEFGSAIVHCLLAHNLPSGRFFSNGRPVPTAWHAVKPEAGRVLWSKAVLWSKLAQAVAAPSSDSHSQPTLDALAAQRRGDDHDDSENSEEFL